MHTVLIFPLVPVLLALGVIGLGGLTGLVIGLLSPSDAAYIAILGSQGSGKTTLWNKLRNSIEDIVPTEGHVSLNEFTVNYDGKAKKILSPIDYGGSEKEVKEYDDGIQKNTFIYYLIDLTKLQENRLDTRARISKIFTVIKEKDLEEKDYGFRLVATNYKTYKLKTGKSKQDAIKDMLLTVDPTSIEGVKLDKECMVAELTDDNDIIQFRKQILNS